MTIVKENGKIKITREPSDEDKTKKTNSLKWNRIADTRA